MILIFDLDGVLVDFCTIHRDAFLKAWNEIYPSHHISYALHETMLEALSTRQKIVKCLTYFALPYDERKPLLEERKQVYTKELLIPAHIYTNTKSTLRLAKEKGHTFACCTNSIRATLDYAISKIDVTSGFFDLLLSNEDVANPKPSPDIYTLAVKTLDAHSDTILVFEDSAVGRSSAVAAGLRVIPIVDALDLTPRFLSECITHLQRPIANAINIVIPMAGLGSRFYKEGYMTPKPFLPICDKPMFQWVIDNIVPSELRDNVNIHLVIREEQKAQFATYALPTNLHLHTVPHLTEGAACTVLTLEKYINNDNPLIIANSDQFLEWDAKNFYYCLSHPDWDGVISTFQQSDPTDLRWSYANINEEGCVTQVAEKKFIGPFATTGIYGWKRGSDFVQHTKQMISDNVRVNNEFYVCPVYNVGIEAGRTFRVLQCRKMWGLGVPSDYEFFLKNYSGFHN
jgi:HAD superfamily hydrolase (TIGR01509 family)